MRLIDADELVKRARPIENFPKGTMVVVLGVVKSLPTVDAEPIRHGKWVWDNKFGEWYCSECQHHKDTEHPMYKPPYCNCCGAKMESE